MSINKSWLTKGVFSIGNNLSNVILRFLSFYIIVRSLSKNDFGIWVIFLIITSILEVVRNGFIKNALIRFISISKPNQIKKIQTVSLLLNIAIITVGVSLILTTLNLLSNFWDTLELLPLFHIYAFTAFFLVFLSHFEFLATAYSKFEHILAFNSSRHLAFLLLVFLNPLFPQSITINNLAIYQLFSALVGVIIGSVIIRKILALGLHISMEYLKKLFHFGKFVVGTNLSAMIFKSTDQIMLSFILTNESVAIYNTALRINNLIDAPIMGISNIFYPHSSRKGESSFTKVYVQSVSVILSILLPILILIFSFSDIIILIIAGDQYTESSSILRVTMLYSVFIPFSRQFGTLLDSIGKPHINLKLTLLTSGINIFASYIGIKTFGIIGAAYGTLFTYSISFIIVQIYLNRTYKVVITDIFLAIVNLYAKVIKTIKGRI